MKLPVFNIQGWKQAAILRRCVCQAAEFAAAFALGVIQALALHPRSQSSAENAALATPDNSLLAKFHYLSTVSGGGYIGSWLSVWRQEKPFAEIWGELVGRPDGPDTEPRT